MFTNTTRKVWVVIIIGIMKIRHKRCTAGGGGGGGGSGGSGGVSARSGGDTASDHSV